MLSQSSPEERQFRDLAEGRMTAEQFQQLEARLIEDSQLRRDWLRFMNLEATMYEECSRWDLSDRTQPSRNLRVRRNLVLTAATIVLVFLATLVLNLSRLQPQSDIPGVRPSEKSFVASGLRGLKDAAVVMYYEHPADEPAVADSADLLQPGARLKPGVVRLEKGVLQLELLCGARLALEGPVELHILNDREAMLVSGVAAARVPEGALGFVLNAPKAAVVDMGADVGGRNTEFVMAVDQLDSTVHVFAGQVELSLLGDDGNTLLSERIGESVTLRVNTERELIEPVRMFERHIPVVTAPEITRLNVPRSYVKMVRDARPVIYWRFESVMDSGLIPNEMGDDYSAELFQPEGGAGIQLEHGHARFLKTETPRTIRSVKALPRLNADAYTIEFWVNPEDLRWSTLVSICPEKDARPDRHLNVLETAHGSSMVHTPGSFRFLHRSPPHNGGGFNAFTDGGCSPGLWHHVVAVKTVDDLRLYLNGKLQKQRICSNAADNETYQIFVGQLRMLRWTGDEGTIVDDGRQFVGQLDEVAVYAHELTDQQIHDHYWTVVRSNPAAAPLSIGPMAFLLHQPEVSLK